MVKVFKLNSPFAILIALFLLGVFLFVGLPLMLLAAAGVLALSFVRSLLGAPQRKKTTYYTPDSNEHSTVVQNEKIGPYRVIENPNDPDVIEVEKL